MNLDEEKRQRKLNGPFYVAADYTISTIHLISPIELKKKLVLKIWPTTNADDCRRIGNYAIDAFIAIKWIFLAAIWIANIVNPFVVGLAVFLLFMNLHTYFWYHLWTIERGAAVAAVEFRERRRFVNLIFAMSYSVALYGYFYHRLLTEGFHWSETVPKWISAIIFSVGNSLTGFSGDIQPISTAAQLTVSSQLVMTFIFVAMLLSNSVPRPRA